MHGLWYIHYVHVQWHSYEQEVMQQSVEDVFNKLMDIDGKLEKEGWSVIDVNVQAASILLKVNELSKMLWTQRKSMAEIEEYLKTFAGSTLVNFEMYTVTFKDKLAQAHVHVVFLKRGLEAFLARDVFGNRELSQEEKNVALQEYLDTHSPERHEPKKDEPKKDEPKKDEGLWGYAGNFINGVTGLVDEAGDVVKDAWNSIWQKPVNQRCQICNKHIMSLCLPVYRPLGGKQMFVRYT